MNNKIVIVDKTSIYSWPSTNIYNNCSGGRDVTKNRRRTERVSLKQIKCLCRIYDWQPFLALKFSAILASESKLHLTMVSRKTHVSSFVLPGGTSAM